MYRGMFSVGNQLSELVINTEMAFGKGNQMSIEESPCSVEGAFQVDKRQL